MSGIAWETAHSVDSRASLPFAWAYMTNVANWDDPPAKFEIEGPFTAGARGVTRMPGQDPRPWRLAEVNPLKSYVLESHLDGAAITFEWRFEEIPGGTRLTQRIVLQGGNAGLYAPQVASAFTPNLAAGMNRIARAMEQAESSGAAQPHD